MGDLLDDPTRRTALGSAARADVAKHFLLSRQLADYLAVYANVLS